MLLYEMFPQELEQALATQAQGGAIAVLPIGSVEQHGPHLPLGCDGYIALATAHMVAEKAEAVLFPMLPFSWIGGLRPFAGTIDMRPFITADYMEAVCLEILGQGFSRLVLINRHGGGREMVFSVARRVYKRTGKPTLTMYPLNLYESWPALYALWEEEGQPFDWSIVETAELAAALRYLKEEPLCQRLLADTEHALRTFGDDPPMPDVPGLKTALRLGEVGHDYYTQCQHVRPMAGISPRLALKALDFMAEKIAQGARMAMD